MSRHSLLIGSRSRRWRRCVLLCWSRLDILHDGATNAALVAIGKNAERDRGNHEYDGCPGGDFGKYSGGAARAEGGLAAHAAEGAGDVSTLTALQKHDRDENSADNHVKHFNEYDQHGLRKIPFK